MLKRRQNIMNHIHDVYLKSLDFQGFFVAAIQFEAGLAPLKLPRCSVIFFADDRVVKVCTLYIEVLNHVL